MIINPQDVLNSMSEALGINISEFQDTNRKFGPHFGFEPNDIRFNVMLATIEADHDITFDDKLELTPEHSIGYVLDLAQQATPVG